MSKNQIKVKKPYLTLIAIFLIIFDVMFSKNTLANINPIKSLSKQGLIEYFSILNQENNKEIAFEFPRDISAFNSEENEEGQTTFSTDDGDYLQLFKIPLDNSERIFYVITHKYIGSFYSGDSNIVYVHEIMANNKLNNVENYDLADAQWGYYSNIEGFAYCEDKVCAHFSIRPFVRWNATLEGREPFKTVDDWIVWLGDTPNIYKRKINRVICLEHKPKLSQKELSEDVSKQVLQGTIHFSNLDKTLEPQVLINVIAAAQSRTPIQSLNMTDLALGEKDLAHLSNWLKNNSDLKDLTLNYNSIDSFDLTEIGEIIRISPNLRTLNLSGNTFKGSAAKQLANAITNAKKLQSVDLSDCFYDAESLALMTEALKLNPSIKEVDLSVSGME